MLRLQPQDVHTVNNKAADRENVVLPLRVVHGDTSAAKMSAAAKKSAIEQAMLHRANRWPWIYNIKGARACYSVSVVLHIQ